MPRQKKASTAEQPAAVPSAPRTPTVAEIVRGLADATELPDRVDAASAARQQVATETPVPTQPELLSGEGQIETPAAGRWSKAVARMARRTGGAIDDLQGIRVDCEAEPAEGLPYARLVTFADDKRPSAGERQLLKDHWFKFNGEAWQVRRTAASQELALRLVNDIKRDRGDAGHGFYV